MMATLARRLATVVVAGAFIGCSAVPEATPAGTAPAASQIASTAPASGLEPWVADLAVFDNLVRTRHPSPWEIHPESEWVSTMARVAAALPTASPNEQIVLVSQLAGLLDTHSCFCDIPGHFHFYGLLPYHFSDGWYIVNAAHLTAVGSRLISIGGVPVDEVAERMAPLVPHDNPMGLLGGLLWFMNTVEYLNGTGIVTDTAHPSFVLRAADGTTTTVDPDIFDLDGYHLASPGYLTGRSGVAPEAVSRRAERIWTRLEEDRHVLLISVNDYGDMTAAIQTLRSAMDDGNADRVVVDMRYLQGGSGDIALLDTISKDDRFDQPGVLTVLIGRENFSAATQVAYYFDKDTAALMVGEPTPARAANFTCECQDETLPNSGFLVSVPLHWDYRDPRPAVEPDVPMGLSSVDFFAGRDPALDAALEGIEAPATP